MNSPKMFHLYLKGIGSSAMAQLVNLAPSGTVPAAPFLIQFLSCALGG